MKKKTNWREYFWEIERDQLGLGWRIIRATDRSIICSSEGMSLIDAEAITLTHNAQIRRIIEVDFRSEIGKHDHRI